MAGTKTNTPYATIKREMEKLYLIEYKTKDGITILQRTQLTNSEKEIMNKLDIKLPPTYLNIEIKDKKRLLVMSFKQKPLKS